MIPGLPVWGNNFICGYIGTLHTIVKHYESTIFPFLLQRLPRKLFYNAIGVIDCCESGCQFLSIYLSIFLYCLRPRGHFRQVTARRAVKKGKR